jgi:hypothetical protein
MATETGIGKVLFRMPVLLGIAALSAVLALAVACGGGEESQGGTTTTPSPSASENETPGATPTQAAAPTPTPVVVEGVSADDDPSWGPDDAPVTIIQFSDYL